MDQRLKHIVENYEQMKIGIDGSFKFHCNQCGKCCINREDILLNPKDLYNIARELKLTPGKIVEEYCETYIGQSSRIPIVRLQPRGTIKRCPLLKDRKCSVHRAKPVVCAMYPIGRCVRVEADKDGTKDVEAGQIEYILNPITCGDKSESHTVREWLEMFDIPAEDAFFIRWHSTIAAIGKKIHEIEPTYPDSCIELVWSLIYSALYLHYEMDKDFDEQFQKNAEKLIDALEHLPSMDEVTENE